MVGELTRRGAVVAGLGVGGVGRSPPAARPRRFQPPVAPAPWTEVANATAYGPASPQRGRVGEPVSEDCLFLNVWTPALRDGGRRPAVVYLHGGAYSSGSGSGPPL